MSVWPNIGTLQNLPQRDLAEIYSAQMATAFAQFIGLCSGVKT
jgi:hypothetical protein